MQTSLRTVIQSVIGMDRSSTLVVSTVISDSFIDQVEQKECGWLNGTINLCFKSVGIAVGVELKVMQPVYVYIT